jgi:hypothetical protein
LEVGQVAEQIEVAHWNNELNSRNLCFGDLERHRRDRN